jgi:hypothetical protein
MKYGLVGNSIYYGGASLILFYCGKYKNQINYQNINLNYYLKLKKLKFCFYFIII